MSRKAPALELLSAFRVWAAERSLIFFISFLVVAVIAIAIVIAITIVVIVIVVVVVAVATEAAALFVVPIDIWLIGCRAWSAWQMYNSFHRPHMQ